MEKKYTFDNLNKKPMLVVSVNDPSAEVMKRIIRAANWEGADGFLIHLENFKDRDNPEALKDLFSFAEDKPIMALNYRSHYNEGLSDEELTELQFKAVEAGAGCCDVMLDMFDPQPNNNQMTFDEKAVKKQVEYINQLHKMGSQVLMSCHPEFLNRHELLDCMKLMEERGADIAKVSMRTPEEEQMEEGIMGTMHLKKNMNIPFLHICNGKWGRYHRVFAPVWGSCMILCVQQYTNEFANVEKPLLRAVRDFYNNFDYKPTR